MVLLTWSFPLITSLILVSDFFKGLDAIPKLVFCEDDPDNWKLFVVLLFYVSVFWPMLNIFAPANAFFCPPKIFKLVFNLVYVLLSTVKGKALLLDNYFVYGFWTTVAGFGYYLRVVFDKNEL